MAQLSEQRWTELINVWLREVRGWDELWLENVNVEDGSDLALDDRLLPGAPTSGSASLGIQSAGTCETTPGATFDVPITFTIYDGTGTTALAAQTQTAAVAYRPSASAQCVGGDAGKWYNAKDKTCYNGFPQTVTMLMDPAPLTDNVIWSVKYATYNTNGYVAGPADSLTVGVFSFPNSPYSGTDLNADEVFRNGAMESGWTGNRPLGTITTMK